MRTVLEPLSAWKQRQAMSNMIYFVIIIVCFIAFAVSAATNFGSGGGSFGGSFYFWIAFPICMLCFVAFQFYVRAQASAAVDRIRQVVANLSRQHTSLTFNVRADMFAAMHRRHTTVTQNYYIEVSIIGGGMATVPGQAVYTASSVTPVVSAVVAGSTPLIGQPVTAAAYPAAEYTMPTTPDQMQQSLQQIEQLYRSGLLSKPEYDAKRAEIIARI
jgi:hypothetical protein